MLVARVLPRLRGQARSSCAVPRVMVLFYKQGGTPYPVTVCSVEMFQALEDLEARSDDVVLVSYPKCEMKQIPSPRILAMHLNYGCLPKSIFKNKAKILVLFRNPKDTAVSFFHFHNNVSGVPSYSSWDEFFSEFMNGKEPASVKQIAGIFGFSPMAEQIQSAAERAPFQAVKDKAQETDGAGDSFLFRKGVVGDWKNLFTEAQNQEMDAKFKVCLRGTKLGAKLKYDVY